MKPRGHVPLEVLLIDPHPFFRAGVREELNCQKWLRVTYEADDAAEAAAMAGVEHPAFILIDASRPRATVGGIVFLRQRYPSACIVAFTIYNQWDAEHELIAAGADSCFGKGGAPEELLALLGALYDRRQPGSRSVGSARGRRHRKLPLTEREEQILLLTVRGATAAEVGEEVGLSRRTVEAHTASIRKKLGAHNRMELVRYALMAGWSLDEPTHRSKMIEAIKFSGPSRPTSVLRQSSASHQTGSVDGVLT